MLQQTFPAYYQRSLYWSATESLTLALRLLCSNRISTGPELREVTKWLAEKYSCDQLFAVGSGRCAITLFLRAVQQQRPAQNKILVPFYICPSVLEAIQQTGFTPSYLPIGKNLNLCQDVVERHDAEGAAAIIIPHTYGYPADVPEIAAAARQKNPDIVVLDDAAAAFDVRYGTTLAGRSGDGGILSFSQGKMLNASGGGILFVHNRKLLADVQKMYEQLSLQAPAAKLLDFFQVLRRYGFHRFSDPVDYWLSRLSMSRAAFRGNFSRMANLDAALLLRQRRKIRSIHNRRGAIIRFFHDQLDQTDTLFFAQGLVTGMPPVSRLYVGLRGHKVELTSGFQIRHENPFFLFLRSRGIKAFYPYFPVPGQGEEYDRLWMENQWLLSLVGLPVDFRREPAQYSFLIDTIMEYIGRYG